MGGGTSRRAVRPGLHRRQLLVRRVLSAADTDKRFLGGITGKPNPERIKGFEDAARRARSLAFERLKAQPRDPEGLYALTLCAGMRSDAESMLLKKHS